MNQRSATTIMNLADPAADVPVDDLWADAEGQATHERIIADKQPTRATRPPRRRRRVLVGTALAGAAGAAVALVGLPGASHDGAPSASAVTKNANGSVTVAIEDYRDRAGLQAKLRAAGIRADVQTITDSCAGEPDSGAAKHVVLNGDLSTFTDGRTWQRLFAGSPWSLAETGPTTVDILITNVDASAVLRGLKPSHGSFFSFTVNPNELPPGDTMIIGFPASDSPKAGQSMVVDVEKTGTPINCTRTTQSAAPTTPAH
jgi:hypothetical protein